MGAFFNENETAFDDSTFELPGGSVISEDDFTCNGEAAEVRVLMNQLTAEKPVVFTEDLQDVRLNENGQLFMFAIVGESYENSDIPRPDDAYLRQYLGLSANNNSSVKEMRRDRSDPASNLRTIRNRRTGSRNT